MSPFYRTGRAKYRKPRQLAALAEQNILNLPNQPHWPSEIPSTSPISPTGRTKYPQLRQSAPLAELLGLCLAVRLPPTPNPKTWNFVLPRRSAGRRGPPLQNITAWNSILPRRSSWRRGATVAKPYDLEFTFFRAAQHGGAATTTLNPTISENKQGLENCRYSIRHSRPWIYRVELGWSWGGFSPSGRV